MMQRAADQPVRPKLAAQRAKLLALAILQESLRNAKRTSKSRDDSSHRGNLHLRGGVAYQVNLAISHLPAHRYPATINRYARALPFKRLHTLFLEEPFKKPFGFSPIFANDADCRALR